MDINIDTIPCLAPFSCLNTRFDTYSICCSSAYLVNEKFAKNKDIFNNFIYRKLRRAMITKEKIPYECLHCINNGIPNQNFEFDKHSIKEVAKQNIEAMDENYFIADFKVATLYVSMDRTCNLSCRMCNSTSSTSYDKHLSKIVKDEFGISNRIPSDKDAILDVLEKVDLSYLRKMEFQGGELFLSKLFLETVGKLPNVKLDLITNGTVYNEELLKKLKHFDNLVLKVSIDGNKEVSEYIRCGSNYDTAVDNIKKFSKYLDNAKIEISTTISKYNASYLIETMNAFSEFADFLSDIKYHFLIDNTALSIYSIDINTRKKIIDKLSSGSIKENKFKLKMIEIVQHVIRELNVSPVIEDSEKVNTDSSSYDQKVDNVFQLKTLPETEERN